MKLNTDNQQPATSNQSPLDRIIHERAPLTVAAFMELALYHPEFGYYARAAQRTGRAGDFFTSVDVGPIFGELLEVQIAEMAALLNATAATSQFDLVEAGAGNGRLAADILRRARREHPALYDVIRLHLVEAGSTARAVQAAVLGDVADRLVWSDAALPESFEGVLIANELFDAMPVHQVVMRKDGLREVYVSHKSASHKSASPTDGLAACGLATSEGPPSTPALSEYLAHAGVQLEPGWRVEVNLAAIDWIRDAARRLRRGFMILIDYGHEAGELYSATHSAGTLTSFTRHRSVGPEAAGAEWLRTPGEQDITSHVDFTSLRTAAEAEGMETIALLDQTYFLLGLFTALGTESSAPSPQPFSTSALHGFKTLIVPGGLGSSHKALLLGKGVGRPPLQGCSFKVRVT